MDLKLIKCNACDLDVVNAARVSYAQHIDDFREKDKGLIKFLIRERHGTPFEHGSFTFHVEAPIFVFREWQRHRAGHSFSEMSGRYVELEDRFYDPEHFRTQVGKPGAYKYELMENDSTAEAYGHSLMEATYEHCWETYKWLLDEGVAREQARAVLPLGIYSQMYWTCNPRSLMHFIGLRNDSNAQEEIRVLAQKAEDILLEKMPVTGAAFIEMGRKI